MLELMRVSEAKIELSEPQKLGKLALRLAMMVLCYAVFIGSKNPQQGFGIILTITRWNIIALAVVRAINLKLFIK